MTPEMQQMADALRANPMFQELARSNNQVRQMLDNPHMMAMVLGNPQMRMQLEQALANAETNQVYQY